MSVFDQTITGFNFGGWLAQSDLSPEHLAGFIRQDDVRWVASRGFNTIRLPFNAQLLQAGGLAWLDKAWGWAKEAKLNLILDLHQIDGHSFVDAAENDLYTSAPRQAHGRQLWTVLAEHYKGQGDDLAFELLNEAVAPTPAHWQAVAEDWAAAIRAVDPARPIVMGSNLWNCPAEFASLKPLPWPKVLYTFHYYEPHHFTHQGAPWVQWAKDLGPQPYPGESRDLHVEGADPQVLAQAGHLAGPWDQARLESLLKPVLDFRQKHPAPVFCGEFGVYLKAARPDRLAWISDFCALLLKHGLGFTYWNYRNLDYGLCYTKPRWVDNPEYQNAAQRDEALADLLGKTALSLNPYKG